MTRQLYIDAARVNDFAARINKQFIGADQYFSLLDGMRENNSYPPYNLEKLADDAYKLTIAVAGFKKEEIEIKVEDGRLIIAGSKTPVDPEEDKRQFLHVGIAERDFKREFKLAEYMVVQGAALTDGLLEVSLKRELPEALKPRTIDIV